MRPLVLGWAVLLALVGCRSSPPPPPAGSGGGPGDNLAKIYKAYRQANVKLNRPPRSLAELKPHLDAKDDKVFISPRDGEAYEIVWSVDVLKTTPNPTKPLVFAYEKKGQSGSRYVLTTTGPRLLSDAELQQAQFPPGHQLRLN